MTLKSDLPAVPSALVDVALVDAPTAAAVGGMSVSYWLDLVRLGRAPLPVVRRPRCTRWSMSAVREFWAAQANVAAAGTPHGKHVVEVAKRASAAAKVAKAARQAQ